MISYNSIVTSYTGNSNTMSNNTIEEAVNELLVCLKAESRKEAYPTTAILEITPDQVVFDDNKQETVSRISGYTYLQNGMRLVMMLDVDPDEGSLGPAFGRCAKEFGKRVRKAR